MKEVGVVLKAVGAAKTAADLRKIERQVHKLQRTAKRGLGEAAGNLERIGTVGAAAAVGGLVASVKVAADFEAQLNVINTIAQTTPERLKSIGDGIRGLARETGAPLDDLTAGYYDLLSAGVSVEDAQGVLRQALKLGQGALGTTSEGVDVVTTALNAFGLAGEDATRISDELATAVALGKVTLTDIAGSYAQVASIAASSGIGTEEVAAAYATLTANGVPASEAMTQMRAAIVALAKPSKDLEKLQEKLGVSFIDVAGEKGLHVALQQLRTEAEKSGINVLDLMGRVEGYNYLLQTTGPNHKRFAGNLELVADGAGALDKQVSARQQGLAYQMGKLTASFRDAGITIGSALLPKLTPLVERLTKFIQDNEGEIGAFAGELATGLGGFFDKIDAKKLGQLVDTLKGLATSGRDLVNAFLNMPSWAQELLIGGFAANKLTGGAVASITGQLASGLIKGVLGMTAGVVNLTAGMVNGAPGGVPGLGGPAGAAGKGGVGGLLGGGARALGGILATGGAAAIGTGLAVGAVTLGSALAVSKAAGGYRPTGVPKQYDDRMRLGGMQPVTVNVSVNVTAREAAKQTAVKKSWSKPGIAGGIR